MFIFILFAWHTADTRARKGQEELLIVDAVSSQLWQLYNSTARAVNDILQYFIIYGEGLHYGPHLEKHLLAVSQMRRHGHPTESGHLLKSMGGFVNKENKNAYQWLILGTNIQISSGLTALNLVLRLGAFNKEEGLKRALTNFKILFVIFRWHFYSTLHQDNLVHQKFYIQVLDL